MIYYQQSSDVFLYKIITYLELDFTQESTKNRLLWSTHCRMRNAVAYVAYTCNELLTASEVRLLDLTMLVGLTMLV